MVEYGAYQSKPLRVLVVEDNPEDAELTIARINGTELWTEVKHVSSLAAAHDFLRTRVVDLIFLDLQLPNGQGLESLRRTRRMASVEPIIVITGFDQQVDAVRAMEEEGAQAFIRKEYLTAQNAQRIIVSAIARQKHFLNEVSAVKQLY